MLNKKEILNIIVITLILAFSISILNLKEAFVSSLILIFIVIIINIIFKKLTAYYLDIKTTIKIWEIKQWGFKRHFHFKKPLSLGILLPLILKIISVGYLNFTASLTFDVKAKLYRAAKRHGLYAFSEISEAQIGAIAAIGIFANLLFALIGYFAGFPTFARLSIGFAFWNLLPISNLDGNKIFFGSLTLWTFLMALTLVGVALALFMI